MRTKIKINNVQSLTDARYYAAMGVDFLGFSPLTMDTITIRAIVDWVAGPVSILDIRSGEDMTFVTQLPNIQGVHLLQPIELMDYNGIVFENVGLHSETSISTHFPVISLEKPFDALDNVERKRLQQWSVQSPLWLSIPVHFVKSYINALAFEGLVMENKMVEQAVGVQEFDDMDLVFDLLNNI